MTTTVTTRTPNPHRTTEALTLDDPRLSTEEYNRLLAKYTRRIERIGM